MKLYTLGTVKDLSADVMDGRTRTSVTLYTVNALYTLYTVNTVKNLRADVMDGRTPYFII